MNNKKLERLNLLLKIAKQKTSVSALLFAKANQALTKEQQSLAELERYQQDYIGVMANHVDKKTTTLQLKTDQLFLDHLSQVIKQQGLTIDSVVKELEKRKELWQKCHQREDGLKKYCDKIKEEELQAAEIKLQREIDVESTSYWVHRRRRSGD